MNGRSGDSNRRGSRRSIFVALTISLAMTHAAAAHGTVRPLPHVSPLALASTSAPADSVGREPPELTLGAGGIGADKFQHVSLAAAIGIGAGIATRSNAAALVTPLVLGFAKEIRDRRHTRFDPADLAADAVGALIALSVTAAVVH